MNLTAFFSGRRKGPPASTTSACDGREPEESQSFRARLFVSRRVSRVLVITCFALSAVLSVYAVRFDEMSAQYEFRKQTLEGVESLRVRIGTYAQVLAGTAAHVATAPTIEGGAFDRYVAGLDLPRNFPGIVGIGFVQPVDPSGIGPLEAVLSAQHGRKIQVHPETSHRDKMIVTQMAPLMGNEASIGRDLSFENGRRSTLAFARQSRETTLSSRVQPVDGLHRDAAFVIAHPVYRAGPDMPATAVDLAGGDSAFAGWVTAQFVGRSVLVDLARELGNAYHVRISEGTRDTLVFDSHAEAGKDAQQAGGLQQTYVVDLYGRRWTLHFTSTPRFDAGYDSHLPELLFVVGLLLTLLVWSSLRANAWHNKLLATVADTRARQLDAREQENRGLLETSVLAVMTLDSDGRIAFANTAALSLFGHGCDTLIGRAFDEFVTLGTDANLAGTFNAVGIAAQDKELLLDVQANKWRTAEGALHTTVLIRDVTEQMSSSMAIEALHRRYDVALNGAGIGIFELDLTTGAAEVSETWHRIMGTDALEVAFDHKTHFLSRVHPDDLPALLDADRQCIAGEIKRSEAEYRVKFGDGWRWMYSNAVPVARDRAGRATRLIGTQADVTSLRHARNALETSEARFRMVLEDAPVGMAVLSESGAFIDVNNALATLSGYDTETLGREMQLADLLSRKDFVQITRDIRVLVSGGSRKTYQNQFQMLTRSGEQRWGLFNFSWTYDKNRLTNVYIAQIVDITDQKRVEMLKSEFVATVSHELRTPLTSIKGALGLLDATVGAAIAPNARRLLEIARVNSDRLTVMVNDILDLEKLASGEAVFAFENVPLRDILTGSIAAMQPVALEHDNTLELEQGDGAEAASVHADAGRLRQVLDNLVSNACKFSHADSPVTLRSELGEGDVKITVENSGPMVPDSFRTRMFEAFTQLDGSDTRSKGGTGLGLNIARQIVQNLGGRIGFDQDGDGKTVFWFTCPLAIEQDMDRPVRRAAQQPDEAGALRIVHLEHDTDFAHVIAAAFGTKAQISHETTLAGARRAIARVQPDVILIDLDFKAGRAVSLFDVVTAQDRPAVVVALSAAGDPVQDPRIALCMTKSQTDVSAVVERILNLVHIPQRKAAI